MKHWALVVVGSGLALAVGTAVAADLPAPVMSHLEPKAVAEPRLMLGRYNGATVAASDSGFMVVYGGFDARVFGRLLDADGTPVGPPFVINDDSRNGASFSVVFDGNQFVVAWLEHVEGEEQLWVQRVNSEGGKVGVLERTVVGETQVWSAFAIARSASGTIAMACTRQLEHENNCRTWVVSNQGVTQADELPVAGYTFELDLESSDGELLAALGTPAEMTLLRVDENGAFSEGSPAIVANSTGEPTVVATEDGWAILSRNDADTRLTMLDFEGELTTAATPLMAANVPTRLTAYAVPNGYLVVTNEYVSGCGVCPTRQLIRHFSPAWELMGEPIAVQADRYFLVAALSVSDSRIATLWAEGNGVVSRLHDPNDFALMGRATPMSEVPSWQSGSRSAPGPGGWLVAWSEYREVRARLLDESGVPKGETITLGRSEIDDFALRVTEVSGRPEGWLVAWSGLSSSMHVSLLDQAAEIQHEVLSISGEYLQAVPVKDGWSIAFNHFELNKGMAVATRQLGLDGSLSEPQIWSEFSANNERAALDITPSGEGYRIWWASGGTVHAKDVVRDAVQDVTLPVFDVSNPTWLSAAQSSKSVAVAWGSQNGFYLATSKSPTAFGLPDWYPTELRVIRDTPLVAWTRYEPGFYQGAAELHSTEDALGDNAFDSVDNTREAAISQARDNKLLLTFGREQDYFGGRADRVYATVVTMAETEAGDAGGAGPALPEGGAGAGGDTGRHIEGGAGTPTDDGGEMSGAAAQASGGMSPGGAGTASGETPESTSLRNSRSCGCRAVSSTSDNDAPYLLLFGLLAIRRRRAGAMTTQPC